MPLLGTRGAASARGFGFGAGGGNWWPVGVSFNFTNTGLNGPTGPSIGQFTTAYAGQIFLPYFSSNNGIQILTGVLPGRFRVTLFGAQGNDPNNNTGTGGYGAIVRGDFTISSESNFYILVGQRGVKTGGANPASQPGGGMSAFWIGSLTSASAFGVAGGGGGSINGSDNTPVPGSATSSINGANANGDTGGGSPTSISTDFAMSGAGWLQNAANTDNPADSNARRPLDGGNGGIFIGGGSSGGFGGGGCQTNSGQNRAGGGGGYTGGQGANQSSGNPGGFGGGSFFSGATSTVYIAPQAGSGDIFIQRIL